MGDLEMEYRAILSENSRLRTRIAQLEDAHDSEIKELNKNKIIEKDLEKKIRNLCITILAKKQASVKDKNWFDLDLNALADLAINEYKNQTITRNGLVRKMTEVLQKQSNIIVAYEQANDIDLISQLKAKGVYDDLKATYSKFQEQKIVKVMNSNNTTEKYDVVSAQPAVSSNEEEIEESTKKPEDKQKESKEDNKDVLNSLTDGDNVPEQDKYTNLIIKLRDTFKDDKRLKILEDRIEKIYTKDLLDDMFNIVNIIGTDGYSLMSDLNNAYDKNGARTNQLSTYMGNRSRYKAFIGELISSETQVSTYYYLSDLGKASYTILFNKKPVLSLYEILIRDHNSLKHGSGIYNIMLLLKSAEIFDSVKMGVKGKGISLSDGTSYEYDVFAIKGEAENTDNWYFFEYELDNHNQEFFNEKVDKLHRTVNQFLFVVPNRDVAKGIYQKFYKWYSSDRIVRGRGSLANVTFNITTIGDLKSQIEAKKEYETWWRYSVKLGNTIPDKIELIENKLF